MEKIILNLIFILVKFIDFWLKRWDSFGFNIEHGEKRYFYSMHDKMNENVQSV